MKEILKTDEKFIKSHRREGGNTGQEILSVKSTVEFYNGENL